MKERPIIFSAEMVRAILDGRKTQTRRIVRFKGQGAKNVERYGQPSELRTHSLYPGTYLQPYWPELGGSHSAAINPLKDCPFGQPGDRLWVRETFCLGDGMNPDSDPKRPTYRADWPDVDHRRWRPSIHMPRWASRIDLEVTGVRVERLQDISEDDAKAEGLPDDVDPYWQPSYMDPDSGGYPSARLCFEALWNDLHGPDAWDENPWVWVIEFKRVEL